MLSDLLSQIGPDEDLSVTAWLGDGKNSSSVSLKQQYSLLRTDSSVTLLYTFLVQFLCYNKMEPVTPQSLDSKV